MDEGNKFHTVLDIHNNNDTTTTGGDDYRITPSTLPQQVVQEIEQATSHQDENMLPSAMAGGTADPSSSLAQQLSNQTLGDDTRPHSNSSRARPPAAARPQVAGPERNAPTVEGHGAGAVARSPTTLLIFAHLPERNPDQYGLTADRNHKKSSQQSADFFNDSITRARERNQRYGYFYTYPFFESSALLLD